jgi:hypothetical protein
MKSNEDDEFKDVIKGLPTENTAQRSSIQFAFSFLGAALLLVVLVLAFGGLAQNQLQGMNTYVPQQMLINGLLSLLLGSMQAGVFRSKIRSRPIVFVIFSLAGGLAGGFVGGMLINSGINNQPALIGVINGAISGGTSSLVQNGMMGNKKYGGRWFLYNLFSWPLIFAVAWSIAWQSQEFLVLAMAGAFVVIASGIGLTLFLRRSPQIEFS